MQRAGGYQYSPEERQFAEELQKRFPAVAKRPGPEVVQTDKAETVTSASSDVEDVSWVVPTAQFRAATFVPGTAVHTWQGAACAGSSIGRKGMLVAARTLALAGVELFENPSELQAARDAFDKRRTGRTGRTHILRVRKKVLPVARETEAP
jgi:aminobenzoyl-glutamate utilization protein B